MQHFLAEGRACAIFVSRSLDWHPSRMSVLLSGPYDCNLDYDRAMINQHIASHSFRFIPRPLALLSAQLQQVHPRHHQCVPSRMILSLVTEKSISTMPASPWPPVALR